MNNEGLPRYVQLQPKGLAVCDFAFRDGPALGLSKDEAYVVAKRLAKDWDGSRTLKEMYLAERALESETAYEDILDAEEIE